MARVLPRVAEQVEAARDVLQPTQRVAARKFLQTHRAIRKPQADFDMRELEAPDPVTQRAAKKAR